MDLRKFLVFFVLVVFMLNINVFASSSIYGIENITELPWDAKEYDYIIGYDSLSKHIIIGVYRSGVNVKYFNVTENGVYDESGKHLELYYRTYKPSVGEWSTTAAAHTYVSWLTETGIKPIFSNKDVYHNGQIYIYGKKFDENLGVFGSLTSNVIFVSLLKPLLILIPLVLIFIILYLTFIKAWKFVKGVF